MKKYKLTYWGALLIMPLFLNAQFGGDNTENTSQNVDSLIASTLRDANKILEAYVDPFNKAFVFALGQFNYTGFAEKDDKKFSLGFKTTYLIAPPSDRTYYITDLQLETLEPEDPARDEAQTVFGDTVSTVRLVSKQKDLLGRPLYSVDAPAGTGLHGFPLPYLHADYKTSLLSFSGSFIPPFRIPGTDFQMILLKAAFSHNLSRTLGLSDKTEWALGLSAGIFNGKKPLNIRPEGFTVNASLDNQQTGPYDNQEFKVTYTTLSFYTHGAYKLNSVFKIYAGIGMVTGRANIQLKGTYPVYIPHPTNLFSVLATDVDDPIELKKSYGQFYGELGLRADWKRLYLQTQLNLGHYSGLSVGLGYKIL